MYVIKALTNIKYKVNIIITNQRNNQNVCTNNNANEKNEDNPFVSMFPIKKWRRFPNIRKTLNGWPKSCEVGKCYLLIPLFNPIYVFNDDLYKC